jgi:hypothetical protein
MYESAFARQPTEMELRIAMEFLDVAPAGQIEVASDAKPPIDVERWYHFAHALINTKEFIYLR